MALPKIPNADELNNANCSCGEDCCGGSTENGNPRPEGYIDESRFTTGRIAAPAGEIPVVASVLGARDRWGTFRMRAGIGRSRYAIAPGLYAVGTPDPWSPIFVSANYKLSFDRLRASLTRLNAWLLVLDTKGINVWCAAGKGTFGTEEVVRRIGETGLAKVAAHRTLILPQLGAPGVAAHEVAKRTGFRVVYGPIRAADIPAFISAGMKATPEMRRVRFPFRDRLILTPVELSMIVQSRIFQAAFLLWVIGLVAGIAEIRLVGLAFLGAILAGTVLTPAFLPWIPVRLFAAKGWILGLLWAAVICALRGFPPASISGGAAAAAYLLLLPALSAFLAMNFTGSSTFTSLSGVVAEMKTAVPLMILSGVLGLAAAVVSIALNV
jgi:hypothetical protein